MEATLEIRDEEADLVGRAQRGDRAAFRALYDAHVRRVSAHVARLLGPGADVEDVTQKVFIQVHRSLPKFKGNSKFSTWLYRVTWNVTVSHMRRRPQTVELPALRQFAADEDAWSRLDARAQLRTLYAGLADLNEDQRRAFVLFELEGASLAEIAEQTGDSINTVASRVRRARERLRSLLEHSERSSAQSARGGKG